MLAFTVPAGVAAAAATLASYAMVRGGPGASVTARTAAVLAVFAVGLWVLALVAGRPTPGRVVLVAAMAAGLVPLLAVPLARRFLALQLPSAAVLAVEAAVVLATSPRSPCGVASAHVQLAVAALGDRDPGQAGRRRAGLDRPGAGAEL